MPLIGARRALPTSAAPSWVMQINGVSASLWLNCLEDLGYHESVGVAPLSDLVSWTRATSGAGHSLDYASDVNGNWRGFGANAPRRTSSGLLSEIANTNNVLQTAFASGWSAINDTLTTGQPDPAGGNSAALIVPNTTSNAAHGIYNATSLKLMSGAYTASVFVKPAGYSFANLSFGSGSTRYSAVVNLTTGAVTQNRSFGIPRGQGSPPGIVYANDWVRIQLQLTIAATVILISASPTGTPTTDGGLIQKFTGDGKSGIYVWVPQVEPGSVVTSPIPTTSWRLPAMRTSEYSRHHSPGAVDGPVMLQACRTTSRPTTLPRKRRCRLTRAVTASAGI